VTAKRKIAWIGAGKMGLPVCRRLQAAGYDVHVFARRPEQAKALSEMSFGVADSIPVLIQGADVVFTCVSDDQALADVTLSDAFKPALAASATFIDMSTVSPSISEKIAAHLPATVSYLRAPVSGSTVMAEAGTLTALVSGPKIAFDAVDDVFSAFTKKAFHLGDGEEARYLKLAINSMVAATSALLGEALAFGLKGGLTHENMLEVITQSAVASPLIGYKKNMIISGDYKPAATLNMLMKDLDLLLTAAGQQKTPMPANSVIRQIYQAAAAKGLGEKDFFVLVDEAEQAARAQEKS
jgi:3-hydroxyisobutyrate dehydrogenase-like beta-hydroxyacid dehydrogenase